MSEALASYFADFGAGPVRPSLLSIYRSWFARETVFDRSALARLGLEGLV